MEKTASKFYFGHFYKPGVKTQIDILRVITTSISVNFEGHFYGPRLACANACKCDELQGTLNLKISYKLRMSPFELILEPCSRTL